MRNKTHHIFGSMKGMMQGWWGNSEKHKTKQQKRTTNATGWVGYYENEMEISRSLRFNLIHCVSLVRGGSPPLGLSMRWIFVREGGFKWNLRAAYEEHG